MTKMRSGFYAVVCDYDNQQFIDTEAKTVMLNQATCAHIVKNTILFSFLQHEALRKIYMILDIAAQLSYSYNNIDLKIPEFDKIYGEVKACWDAHKEGEYAECYDYCNYYSVNSLSPIIEGYTYHINTIFQHLKNFLKKIKKFIPQRRRKNTGYLFPGGRKLALNYRVPEIEYFKKQAKLKVKVKFPKHIELPKDYYVDHHLAGGMGKGAAYSIAH